MKIFMNILITILFIIAVVYIGMLIIGLIVLNGGHLTI